MHLCAAPSRHILDFDFGISTAFVVRLLCTLSVQYPEVYLDLMMVDELGILPDDGDASGPTKQGVMMFASFVTFGAVPLLAYIPNETPWVAFMISCVLTTLCLGVLGVSPENPLRFWIRSLLLVPRLCTQCKPNVFQLL